MLSQEVREERFNADLTLIFVGLGHVACHTLSHYLIVFAANLKFVQAQTVAGADVPLNTRASASAVRASTSGR